MWFSDFLFILLLLLTFATSKCFAQSTSSLVENQKCGVQCVDAPEICVSLEKLCNGIPDCPNGDDENPGLCSGPLMTGVEQNRHISVANPVSNEFVMVVSQYVSIESVMSL